MPTWQGEEFLDRVLAALARQTCPLPWDFTAIDSGSTDRTLAILENWRQCFPVPMRIGHIHQSAFDHGDTRNLLAVESTGDLLVFLTQDAIPTESTWLATLAANFDDPSVGAAYCRNLARPAAHILTRVSAEADPGYQPHRREVRLPDAATYAAMSAHDKRLLYNFNDVASALRRELWERHPFPRTGFGEDVLMARALLEAGYTVVYDDVATVEHSHDYGPPETYKRAWTDGRFNIEWLERTCVASPADAEILTKRQLERDREALEEAGAGGPELEKHLEYAARLRRAAFVGMYEGGLSTQRHRPTRMLDRAKLRILYVVHGFPPATWAGTEVYALGLALEMKRRGHHVVVFTRSPAATSIAEGGPPDFSISQDEFQGLDVWRMTHRLQHGSLAESYDQPRAEAAFRDVLLRVRPDVVHFQHLIHMSARLPRVCREYALPSLITAHDYWMVCARVQLIRPDGVRCDENQGRGCLLCVKGHGYKQIPVARALLPLLEPLLSRFKAASGVPGLARLAQWANEADDIAQRHEFVCAGYAACDLVIAPSRFARQKLLATGKLDPHRVLYSENGTLTDHVRAIRRGSDPHGRIRFGYVGSLLWYKGVDVLVRAMSLLADKAAVLHVYGDFEPERDAFHAALQDLAHSGPGNVVFHGRFANSQIAAVYEQIDVLVVPSIWFENAPVTIQESFLFHTPIVTSNIGGMAELVRDGVDGLHFSVGDARDLAAKLARFIDEPGLLAALSTSVPPVKTMAEDAREMEVRYRGRACVVQATGSRTWVDRPGIPTVAQGGPVEVQRGDLALLRPGGAWVEYEVAEVGPGRVSVRVDIYVVGAETNVPLGGTVAIDGQPIGSIESFCAVGGPDEVRSFLFEADLSRPARHLRIDTRVNDREVFLRIARVVVGDAPPPGVESPASAEPSLGSRSVTAASR